MPLTLRNSAGRRRKHPDEKLSERPGEPTSSLVMAPTRMKLRVRRPDGVAATRGGQPAEREQRSQESSSRSSRRKNTSNTTTAAAATSSPPTSSPPTSSTSVRAVVAAEETSPDSKCPICLDRFNNLAYLDRCLHRFCFPCIQEWSHNKAECPLCKQPFTSILHSVRAEDDFKEYTLRPAPANSSVAATVAMVAAMASAARSDHQMRLMLRRHRTADSGEMTTRRRRRERGGREGGNRRTGVWEWYLDSPPLRIPPLPHHPAVSPMVAEDSGEGDVGQQRMRGGADMAERGVIFEGLTALGGGGIHSDGASRRLMTRLAVRQRLQREGGNVQRLRERETVAFRRALYRCGVRVHGIAGINGNQTQQCDITAECFRRNPAHLNRLRPWLRRELTVLYGAHGTLVDIVQRIILAQLTHHGLEDLPTVEDELRPFLLARTDHFLHELVSFARSPLSLENYDLQAVYEPPTTTLELDGISSPSDTSSVIAISEGEEEASRAGVRSESLPEGTHDDVIQTGSCLSLSAWDDETPGPSYSSAEPSCSLSFSPAPQEAANHGEGQRLEEEGEDECLIVGYKKPIAERTPELVQLSSDTEGDDKGKEEAATEKLPVLPSTSPPLPHPPTVPPSTSAAAHEEQDDKPEERAAEGGGCRSRARSWSDSSGKSQASVCTLGLSERRQDGWTERKQSGTETVRDKRRRKNRRGGRERSGTLSNPNRSIYPAMMCRRSRSPCHSSIASRSPPPLSPLNSSWEYLCSPLPSSDSSLSHSSPPLCLSPHLSSPPPQTPPTPSLTHCDSHHREKPGGKRKYKSRHLDSTDRDPTWRPSSSHHRQKRKESERRSRRGRDGGRRRERQKRESGGHCGESSSSSSSSSSRSRRRRCREDRSPSVEIIYEGLVTSDTPKPPARKRRKKRHRKTQHSSSLVIITLDSDNSHDDANNQNINISSSSSSSSPLSSQQTIDFSELPPLPLVHSAGVSGALDAEIGELPVDILDRGSEGSETEPLGQSETAGSIAVGQINGSDSDVNVEKVDESRSLVECDEARELASGIQVDKRSTSAFNAREATSENSGPQQTGDNDATPTTTDLHWRNPEVLTSDSCLLAIVLDDLRGIPPPKCDPSKTSDPSCSPDTRKKHFSHLCEARQGHSNQDGWSTDPKPPNADFPEERQDDDDRDQDQALDLLKCWSSSLPLPPPLQAECREEQAGPVQRSNRKTTTPIRHNDAESPHLSPSSPADCHSPLFSVHIHPVSIKTAADLNSDQPVSHVDACLGPEPPTGNQALPPISTLNTQVNSLLPVRGVNDTHTSCCYVAPVDSHSAAPSSVGALTTRVHSTSLTPVKSPSRPGSESRRKSSECLPQLDSQTSLHSFKLHSSCLSTADTPSPGLTASLLHLHAVSSVSAAELQSARPGWSREKAAHTDSTSRGHGKKSRSPNFCRGPPSDFRLSCTEEARAALAGSVVFSGLGSPDASPVPSVNSRTESPSSDVDPLISNDIENQSGSAGVISVPTAAPSSTPSPINLHPTSAKFSIDRPTSSAAVGQADTQASLIDGHEDGSPHGHKPHIDFHCPLPSVNLHSSHIITTMTNEHLNHTALRSSTCSRSQSKPGSPSRPSVQPPHSTNSESNHLHDPQFPADSHSKQKHVKSSHRERGTAFSSADNQQNSNASTDAC